MKLRKGLLAAATAATVSITGVVAAPAFAEEVSTQGKTKEQIDKELELKEREIALQEEKARREAEEAQKKADAKAERERIQNEGTSSEKADLVKKDLFYDGDKVSPTKIGGWVTLLVSIIGLATTFMNFLSKQFNIKF